MDYLFIIEFNDKPPSSVETLKGDMSRFGGDIRYLENDISEQGVVGLVRFVEEKDTKSPDEFFDKIRDLVATELNHLDPEKVANGSLSLEDPEIAGFNLARWARASIADVLDGFAVMGNNPDLNRDDNPYQIVNTLKGGIGGKR